jgi:hypothetical protein
MSGKQYKLEIPDVLKCHKSVEDFVQIARLNERTSIVNVHISGVEKSLVRVVFMPFVFSKLSLKDSNK